MKKILFKSFLIIILLVSVFVLPLFYPTGGVTYFRLFLLCLILVESLNIRGMVQNRRLARAIADAAWSRFLAMLRYKATWYGVKLIAVGRFAPTSKRCHVCGHQNDALGLADREWTCAACGTAHDRDINAAQNIKLMGLRSLRTPREPREEPVELSALAEAVKQEARSFRAG